MHDSFENQLRRRTRQLKIDDALRAPSLDDVMQRPRRCVEPLVNRGTVLRAITILMACAIGLYGFTLINVGGHRLENARHAEQVHRQSYNVELDFDEMSAAIDSHFQIPRAPVWTTPTDILLSINLKESVDVSYWK